MASPGQLAVTQAWAGNNQPYKPDPRFYTGPSSPAPVLAPAPTIAPAPIVAAAPTPTPDATPAVTPTPDATPQPGPADIVNRAPDIGTGGVAGPADIVTPGSVTVPAPAPATPAPATPVTDTTTTPTPGAQAVASSLTTPAAGPMMTHLTNAQAVRRRYAPLGGIGMNPSGSGGAAGTHMGTGGMY